MTDQPPRISIDAGLQAMEKFSRSGRYETRVKWVHATVSPSGNKAWRDEHHSKKMLLRADLLQAFGKSGPAYELAADMALSEPNSLSAAQAFAALVPLIELAATKQAGRP